MEQQRTLLKMVALHHNWRGSYALSTDAHWAATTCAPGGGCGDPYPWPGMAPFSYGLNPEFAKTHIWYGSLAKDQYDQSGLQYRRNRYYDPMMGQFTQDDPIGIAGGLNTYGYAAGDPVNFSDPFGLCPDCYELDGMTVTVNRRPENCSVDFNECWGRTRPMAWTAYMGGNNLRVPFVAGGAVGSLMSRIPTECLVRFGIAGTSSVSDYLGGKMLLGGLAAGYALLGNAVKSVVSGLVGQPLPALPAGVNQALSTAVVSGNVGLGMDAGLAAGTSAMDGNTSGISPKDFAPVVGSIRAWQAFGSNCP